ncbi:MAG TPA: diaminopimelate epimerase [Bacteriovoracaceae bacterium]|nr:diaminopimelate epimerase [Bacteriovoracaceae bacterium]
MKQTLNFTKYSGNGNDFVILNNPQIHLEPKLVTEICDRHFGIGADGVLVLSQEDGVDGRMKIFNADGAEAEMCANGLRCLVTYLDEMAGIRKESYVIKTMNSTYRVAKIDGAFAIEMSELRDKNLYDLSTFHEFDRSFFINTGVPHLVFLSTDVKALDLKTVAPKYRRHSFFPNGTNVNFVQIDSTEPQTAYVRTFERGVEDETYSCGTGLTATAMALNFWYGWSGKVRLKNLGGVQTVEIGDKILYSGEVKFCFSGEYHF